MPRAGERPILIIEESSLLREAWRQQHDNVLSLKSFNTLKDFNYFKIIILHVKDLVGVSKKILSKAPQTILIWVADILDYQICFEAEKLRINDFYWTQDLTISELLKVANQKKKQKGVSTNRWGGADKKKWRLKWVRKKPLKSYPYLLFYEKLTEKHLVVSRLLWKHRNLTDIAKEMGYPIMQVKRAIYELFGIFLVDNIPLLLRKLFLYGLTY